MKHTIKRQLGNFFVTGFVAIFLLMVSAPVHASHISGHLLPLRLHNLVAFIVRLDPEAKTLMIRRGNALRMVNAENAFVVKITPEGSRQIALADLQLGGKARFLVRSKVRPQDPFEAFLIVQVSNTRTQPSPPPASALPVVQFSTSGFSAGESATSASVRVNLSKISDQDVKVRYTVTGSATGGGIDHNLSSGTLQISAGRAKGSIPFVVFNDGLEESEETVVLTLSDPLGADLGARKVHTYAIQDDDRPAVGFASSSSSAVEGSASLLVPVRLSKTSDRETRVSYTVSGNALGGGVDYSLSNGELVIPAGSSLGYISLAIADDSLDESDETVSITLSNPTNADLGLSIYTHTILDND